MRLTRIDTEANLARYYRMQIVPGLFGDWGLVREWGRTGSPGRVRTGWFDSESAAREARSSLHVRKTKRGYE